MKVLVTGSRDATPKMTRRAELLVEGWVWNSEVYEVVVGDAPGIDSAIIRYVDDTNDSLAFNGVRFNIEVHGAYNRMRNKTRTGRNIPHNCTYPERDKIMARQPGIDQVIAIWNGVSRGTMITVDYALKLGIPVTIHNFGKKSATEKYDKVCCVIQEGTE